MAFAGVSKAYELMSARRDRKVAKLVREAGFKDPSACVEDVLYLPKRKLSKDRVLRWAECRWVEKCEVMVVISKSGCHDFREDDSARSSRITRIDGTSDNKLVFEVSYGTSSQNIISVLTVPLKGSGSSSPTSIQIADGGCLVGDRLIGFNNDSLCSFSLSGSGNSSDARVLAEFTGNSRESSGVQLLNADNAYAYLSDGDASTNTLYRCSIADNGESADCQSLSLQGEAICALSLYNGTMYYSNGDELICCDTSEDNPQVVLAANETDAISSDGDHINDADESSWVGTWITHGGYAPDVTLNIYDDGTFDLAGAPWPYEDPSFTDYGTWHVRVQNDRVVVGFDGQAQLPFCLVGELGGSDVIFELYECTSPIERAS